METFKGRITIDGKGTFDYTLTPVVTAIPGQSVTIPIPPAGNGNPAVADGDVVSVMIVAHEMKSGITKTGKNAGGTYEKHIFRGSDNRRYDTFDERKTAVLSPLVGAGTPVKMVVKANAFHSFDIVRILGA